MNGQFEEAIAQAKSVLEIDPDYPMALIRLGLAYGGRSRHADAIRAFQRAVEAAPELLDSVSLLGYAHGRAGNHGPARQQLRKLQQLARRRYVPAFLFANVYAGLEDADRALAFIEKEYDARGWYLLLIKHSPQFDVLRQHPRFRALMRRMNFPP